VFSVTPWPRFSPGERNLGTHCTGGWVGHRAGLDTEAGVKILSHLPGIELRSPGRSARSQTLYCLSYLGHRILECMNLIVHALYVSIMPTRRNNFAFLCFTFGHVLLICILKWRWEIVDWNHTAQDRVHWRALVNTLMGLRIHESKPQSISNETNSMEQSPLWEATNRSGGEEIFRLLWKPRVVYCVHKSSSPVPVLNQMESSSPSKASQPKLCTHFRFPPSPANHVLLDLIIPLGYLTR
jgi:hypothetical protein